MKKVRSLVIALVLGLFVILPFKANAASLISSLEIEGIGSIGMSKNYYEFQYETSFDYVKITATPKDSSVTITGAGKVDITEGANTIVVSATDGTNTEKITFVLNVTKITGTASSGSSSSVSYDKDGNEIKNPNTGAFMNVSIVAISLVGASIVINSMRKKNKFYKL